MQNSNQKKVRNDLFQYLDRVLDVSMDKFNGETKADEDRRGWARVIRDFVHEYGLLLKDDELESRVIALEEKLKDGVLLEQHKEKTQ